MSRRAFPLCFVVACFVAVSMLPAIGSSRSFLSQYKGLPYHDSRYNDGAQKIPGKVLCAYYDLGGEGVAYHDSDPKNHGSGELNPADGTYLNEFRIHEGVDISYTKFNRKPDPVDDNPFDKVVPPADLLYVGWTEPGEWFNVTVDVAKSGTYAADFLYTSNRGGTISVDVNGKNATGPLQIATTNDPGDPIAWRQWHHWNLASQLFKVRLSKGKNVLTVHILTNGNMNLAYFDFRPIHE
jgi:Carbohydrate binding module (family 6)